MKKSSYGRKVHPGPPLSLDAVQGIRDGIDRDGRAVLSGAALLWVFTQLNVERKYSSFTGVNT